jgi:hypothetical protein
MMLARTIVKKSAGWCMLMLVLACDGSEISVTEPPNTTPVLKIVALSSRSVTAVAGERADPAPRVLVTDMNGNPMPNIKVRFLVAGGRGSLPYADTITDARGEARAEWALGNSVLLSNQLTVLAGIPAVYLMFDGQARAGPAAFMLSSWQRDLVLFGGTEAPVPNLYIGDRFGNAVPDVTVQWSVVAGSGSIRGASSASAKSGISGLAEMDKWRVGLSGQNTVIARSPGLDSVLFQTVAIDSTTASWYVSPEYQQDRTYQNRLALSADGYFIEDVWVIQGSASARYGSRYDGSYKIASNSITLSGCVDDTYYFRPSCYSRTGRIEGDVLWFGTSAYSRSK